MSHSCEGGCGRQVSATKAMCLDCHSRAVRNALEERGIVKTHEEVKRGIQEGTYGRAKQSAWK